MPRLTPKETRQALARAFESDARLRYQKGEKRALWDMLSGCAAYCWTLPQWAAEAINDADLRSQKAELESWNDVFDEPFQKMKLPKRETKKRETVARHLRLADQIL
jgi:hypothetical protein